MAQKTHQPQVWQIAAGDAGRSYVDVFLTHRVALIGPGDPGPWNSERSDEEFEGGGWVRWFATEVRCGDVMVLRMGRYTVHAIGVVASKYEHLPQFGDVNGWDVRHGRRIHWHKLPERHIFEEPVFGTNPMRLSRIHKDEVLEFVNATSNSLPPDWNSGELPELAPEEEDVDVDELPSDLSAQIRQMQALGGKYRDGSVTSEWPQEAETVAHLVIPLLQSLGWPRENIAVEWSNIDVCVFSTLPREPRNCQILIEAKRLDSPIEKALEQALQYVSHHELTSDVVVTDGLRYRLYLYAAERGYEQVAYANVMRLKNEALRLFERMRTP